MLFCPTCGSEERQAGQFCRACGTDIRAVRMSLERPDDITAAAVSAREQIGRVFAEKIREAEGSKDLKRIAEDVLPGIEKFLESPQEKRLRSARAGVVTAAIGVGVGILALLLLSNARDWEVSKLVGGLGLAVVVFFIGIGLIINALFLTVPRKELPAPSLDQGRDKLLDNLEASTGQLLNEASPLPISSVTEHTTQHLANKRQ